MSSLVTERLAGRLVRGVVGGVLSGLVFAAVTIWFTSSTGGKSDMPLRMISTIVLGDDAMMKGTTSPGVGWLVHLVLSAGFGVVFALLVPWLRSNAVIAVAGTAYGALLFVLNFLILDQLFFTTFKAANKPFELLAHLVFGTLLAFAFLRAGVAGERPAVAHRGEPAASR